MFNAAGHIDYTRWASMRLLQSAASLTHDELTRDFGTADKSVLGTLVHVFAADRIWLGRIEGNVPARFIDVEKDMHLEVLLRDWPPLLDRWTDYLAAHSGDALLAPVSYQDLKGNAYTTPLWQIVLHVVNHGTHHRGQAAGFLRSMGKTPPPLDLIFHYRSLVS